MSESENDFPRNDNGESQEAEPEGVPVRLVGMDEVPVQFASGLHVTNELGAFHLVFSRFTQPVFITSADYEPYAKQGFVPVNVVARVIVTPPVLEEMIRVLQEQLERSQVASQIRSEQRDQGAGHDNEG